MGKAWHALLGNVIYGGFAPDLEVAGLEVPEEMDALFILPRYRSVFCPASSQQGARQPVADSVASLANLPERKNEAICGSPCCGVEVPPNTSKWVERAGKLFAPPRQLVKRYQWKRTSCPERRKSNS
jgi:hypothetical protein